MTALRFAELTQEAGLPEGVFNVVPGPGGKAGMALVRHPGVDKVAFTGSTEVGKGIMREAAGSLKRVWLELGGPSPNIVFVRGLDAADPGRPRPPSADDPGRRWSPWIRLVRGGSVAAR